MCVGSPPHVPARQCRGASGTVESTGRKPRRSTAPSDTYPPLHYIGVAKPSYMNVIGLGPFP